MPKKPEHVIDVDSSTRTGLRGRLDRLLQDHAMKAQALKITLQIIDEEDRTLAVERAPQKFLQAINTRNSHAGRVPVETMQPRAEKMPRAARIEMIATYLQHHDGATTREIADGIGVTTGRVIVLARAVAKPTGGGKSRAPMTWSLKSKHSARDNGLKRKGRAKTARTESRYARLKRTHSPIHGQAMSLFLLEHLDDETPKPLAQIVTALAEAGSPLKAPQAINGPLHVALVRKGYVRQTADGYARTSKGAVFAQTLRPLLESQKKIAPGGYTVAA